MHEPGPLLESLTRRLAECPEPFLPKTLASGPKRGGAVFPAAVVLDLIEDLGGPFPGPDAADRFTPKGLEAALRARGSKGGAPPSPDADAWLRLVLVGAWLLHDPWFREKGRFGPQALAFLAEDLVGLAAVVKASDCVAVPERREELARLALRALGLLPQGEKPAQAQDRLAALDSVETTRLVEEARKRAERSKAVMEAMKKKAAEAAAAKSTRE